MSEFDIILDNSQQNLSEIPPDILRMHNLRMLYLQHNLIKKLPNDFFQHLPQLSWLDLRSNQLTSIPKGIAHHQYLENLLLSDNKLEALPNELGLVPKLKVLQIGNNPLIYPTSKIIAEGTKSILAYLRHHYEKTNPNVEKQQSKEDLDDDKEVKIEKEIRNDNYCDYLPSDEFKHPTLIVKGLSNSKKEPVIHQMSKQSPNKILLRSYYNEDDKSAKMTQTSESIGYIPSTYKESWMQKLKELLEQQEKILQQERLENLSKRLKKVKLGIYRNLQALASWRAEKREEPIRRVSSEQFSPPPYATDHQYETILSREDMHKEIDKIIRHSKNPKNVEKLINDLVSELKNMDTSPEGLKSPKSEIETAGNQIMKIMEMHKKIIRLQETNDMMLP